jgi:hypothetical protein
MTPMRPRKVSSLHRRPSSVTLEKGTITRSFVRRLLGEVLKSDSDLNAFCLDHFPDIHFRFTNGMDRVAKTNLLLMHCELTRIIDELRRDHPEEVSEGAPNATAHETPRPPPTSGSKNIEPTLPQFGDRHDESRGPYREGFPSISGTWKTLTGHFVFEQTDNGLRYVEYNLCNMQCGQGTATLHGTSLTMMGTSGAYTIRGDLAWSGELIYGVVHAGAKQFPIELTRAD